MRNEVKVGILSLVTIVVSVFGYKYLKGSNILERSNTYYIRFGDIGQMDASAPVLIRGFKIGSVTKINLDPENADLILVTIEVNREINLPKNTKAILVSQGLMGGKALVLDYPNICLSDCLPDKSFIPGEIAGMLSSMISKEEINEYAKSVGNEINKILDTSQVNNNSQLAGTVKNIHLILANLAVSTSRINQLLESSTVGVQQSMKNMEAVTGALAKNAEALSNTIRNMDKITAGIAESEPGKMIKMADQTFEESKKALQQITTTVEASKQSITQLNQALSDINNSKGSLGKLINDPALYQNLTKTSKNLDLLLQDLRLNPRRYIHVSVFGKNGRPYEKPITDPADH
ncbi:MAG: MCE family protein [Saprospiraceae bacterium]|nr:MCE family protein [Saprospiraceae bacterium]